MPLKEIEITKLYYSIGEVARMFRVNISLIRFWEKEFEVLNPKKSKRGDRQFTPADVEYLRIIYNLVKQQGLTLDGAKKYLRDNKRELKHEVKGEKNNLKEIENKLLSIRKKLMELQEQLKA